MWIFLNDGFLSIVALKEDPDRLLVRARVAGDLESVFPEARVVETSERDYRFRARVPRERVAAVLAQRVRGLDYPNFKASIPNTERGRDRHRVYLSVWGVMHRWQEQRWGARRQASRWAEDPEEDLGEVRRRGAPKGRGIGCRRRS